MNISLNMKTQLNINVDHEVKIKLLERKSKDKDFSISNIINDLLISFLEIPYENPENKKDYVKLSNQEIIYESKLAEIRKNKSKLVKEVF